MDETVWKKIPPTTLEDRLALLEKKVAGIEQDLRLLLETYGTLKGAVKHGKPKRHYRSAG